MDFSAHLLHLFAALLAASCVSCRASVTRVTVKAEAVSLRKLQQVSPQQQWGGRPCANAQTTALCDLKDGLCTRYGLPDGRPGLVSDCACEDLCLDVLKGFFGPVPGWYNDNNCKFRKGQYPTKREISIHKMGNVLCDPSMKPGRLQQDNRPVMMRQG